MTARENAEARIKSNVSLIRSACKKGKKTGMGEADTRMIVSKVLIDLLGWDEFEDITQEEAIKGGFCDYMVKYEGKRYFVIEVKKVSGGLYEDHLSQASHYAQDRGLEWIVLTNGDQWQVHHLRYKKTKEKNPEPELFEVFRTSFTDTTIDSQERIQLLYLLSKEARKTDDLAHYYESLHELLPEELIKRFLREDVIDRVRIGIKNDIGYRIDNYDLALKLLEIVKDEYLSSGVKQTARKLKDK